MLVSCFNKPMACVIAFFRYASKLTINMQRKRKRLASRSQSRGQQKTDFPHSVASSTDAENPPAVLTPLNFRVPDAFHREFKLYAVQHGMTMVHLLKESFRLMKEKRAR